MKTLTFKVPEAMDVELDSLVREKGEKKSVIVREALEHFLKKRGNFAKGSCFDKVRDLAGCLKGPRDLSVNKAYLKGFGE